MARQRPDPLWTMRKVQGLLSCKPGVSLEAGLMQKPNAIDCSSQVATTTACILSIRGSFLTRQLGGVVDQEAGARVGAVVTGEGAQGVSDRALFLTDVLLERAKFAEAVHNNETWLDKAN